ncbi:MAG: hypothetical protein ABI716_00590 [Candidatus Saccharibacteria bacterium]
MSNQNHSRVGSIIGVVVSLSLLALSGWVVLNRQAVFDQWSLSQYQPPAEVATIADRTALSDKGKFYFYTSQPEVDSAAKFNTDCQRQEAQSAILGCYTGGRIYIYDVTNPQLAGIKEVTAAHEMLHAAWDRMSPTEQKSVGLLLEAEYATLNSPDLNARLAYYQRAEPGKRDNELHSIIGTEAASLSPQLEAHYSQYFTDRSKVVALHNSYQQVFDGISAQSEALLTELNSLASDIKASAIEYNAESASVSQESQALKDSASRLDRTSSVAINQYNAQRQALIARIDQLETLRTDINTKSDQYNTKVAQYEKLVIRSNELTQSIDSALAAPVPSP